MIYTTFDLLHEHEACRPRYRLLAKKLGGIRSYGRATEIPLLTILSLMGVEDAAWAFRACLPEAERDRIARLFACRCVRETPLFDGRKVWNLLIDERSRDTVEVAERYAVGSATQDELYAARDAAARAAGDAAWAAARAAGDASWAAAWAAAGAAAWASGAARDAAGAAQTKILREMLESGDVEEAVARSKRMGGEP